MSLSNAQYVAKRLRRVGIQATAMNEDTVTVTDPHGDIFSVSTRLGQPTNPRIGGNTLESLGARSVADIVDLITAVIVHDVRDGDQLDYDTVESMGFDGAGMSIPRPPFA